MERRSQWVRSRDAIVVCGLAVTLLSGAPISAAALTITDGMNASDLIGQYTRSDGQTVVYTKSATNNAPNDMGLSSPRGVAMDSVNHRLFVADRSNHRVLVYDLNSSNQLVDKVPDHVLGQENYYSNSAANTQSGLNDPYAAAYDSANDLLYVAEISGHRVKVFDVASITDGENAIHVLGQTTWSGAGSANTQSGLNTPHALAYDSARSLLYVSESNANRVKVFDVASITDGENAIHVLGQTTWSGADIANTQSGLSTPTGLAYDSAGGLLYVSESNGNRVKVFDVASVTDGENAIHVLGQSTFTGTSAANTQSGLNYPTGLAYDSANNLLYVSEFIGNRVKVFNVASITDGEDAIHVLGQSTWSGASSAHTQSGLNFPAGLAYDSANNLLYVADVGGNRIKVFDVASITDGENAVDLIGQYTRGDGQTVAYTKSATNNSPNDMGFSGPRGIELDSVNHRLFIADASNHRVLVYDLNSSNQLVDKVPDHVLGQANYYTVTSANTQSGLSNPLDFAYDSANNLLYVAEYTGNRVKVFDVASITDGENAIHVLGQSNFTSAGIGQTQSGLYEPSGLAYDSASSRLFVADTGSNRVVVFDVASITDGENAIHVLGQSTFTAGSQLNTQSGLNFPRGVAYDAANDFLYVTEALGNRVKVFDVSSITDGENAIHVLGQSNFTSSGTANSQSGMNVPQHLAYDSVNNLLYVTESWGSRVKVFDVASITDGEDAVHVLGQSTWGGDSAANTQSGLNFPHGIFYDSANNLLYVVENGAHRIKIFDFSDPPPPVPPRTMRLFEGFTVKLMSGTIKIFPAE